MDASNAEPITEAEAEAMLHALGHTLQWASSKGVSHAEFAPLLRNQDAEHSGWYGVISTRTRWFLRRYVAFCQGAGSHPDSRDPRLHKHIDRAKAACEHHHATGQWE